MRVRDAVRGAAHPRLNAAIANAVFHAAGVCIRALPIRVDTVLGNVLLRP